MTTLERLPYDPSTVIHEGDVRPAADFEAPDHDSEYDPESDPSFNELPVSDKQKVPEDIANVLNDAAMREDQLRSAGANDERIAQEFTRIYMPRLAILAFQNGVDVADFLPYIERDSPDEKSEEDEFDDGELEREATKLGSYDLARKRLRERKNKS